MSVDYTAFPEDDIRSTEELLVSESRFELIQRLAAIVESSDDAIISKTIEGIVATWNSGAERIFGYTAQEMIGQPILRLACNGGEDDMRRVLDQIRRGERVDHYETMRRCKDGREIPVSLTISPLRNPAGEVFGASKIARDISGRKQADQVLQITEKLAVVSRLASSIAHDINNPLAAVTNLLFLLENEILSEQGKQYLTTAQRELFRVSHIATQALGFYRNTEERVWFSLSTIFDDALTLHHDRSSALGIEVSRDYDSASQVFCHPGELLQVMVNLVGNAFDAMPLGGRLRLRIRRATDWATNRSGLRIAVADTGRGISAETRNRIFEPFYTTKEATGTGLGLWVCADIVSRYEGRISMRSSNADGRSGSVFSLFLPLCTMPTSDIQLPRWRK
jgi:PAS domain S-box-containing protein